MNGLVGFQAWEDGTPRSLWLLRISCLVVWAVCFFVSIATFKSWASFDYTKPLGLFVTYLIFPLVCVVFYIVSQLVLVIRTLDDRWVIGDLIFGIAFYAVGCILLVAFSNTICSAVSHYIDGVFFFTLCMLLTVMMVYKVSTDSPQLTTVLGFHHKGRPRIFRRIQASRVGGQGASDGESLTVLANSSTKTRTIHLHSMAEADPSRAGTAQTITPTMASSMRNRRSRRSSSISSMASTTSMYQAG
jgi:hypothetical protein